MLVVANLQQHSALRASDFDTTSMFAQGPEILFSEQSFLFTTFDLVGVAAPQQIHPNISAVTGGNATRGASLMAIAGAFRRKP